MKRFSIRYWFLIWFVVLAAMLLAAGSAYSSGHWFPSPVRPPAMTVADVVEVDRFDSRCTAVRSALLGCYIPEQCEYTMGVRIACQPGRIEVAKRLAPWVRECVVEHERRHERGEDHTDGWGDC